ncbi:MAG: hypothetical protein ABIJ30_06735 [bacterium]
MSIVIICTITKIILSCKNIKKGNRSGSVGKGDVGDYGGDKEI